MTLYPTYPNSVTPSNNPSILASGRWAPMMIDDADIIVALNLVSGETSVVNLSLGGRGCEAETSGFAWGIGERLALGRVMYKHVVGQ